MQRASLSQSEETKENIKCVASQTFLLLSLNAYYELVFTFLKDAVL